MKKLHQSSKYFLHRWPFTFIGGINFYRYFYDDKIFSDVDFVNDLFPNIWITERISMGCPTNGRYLNADWAISRIVRCEATTISLFDCDISEISFEILTQSKQVKQFHLNESRIVNDSGNLSLEEILCNLPNAEEIQWVFFLEPPDDEIRFQLGSMLRYFRIRYKIISIFVEKQIKESSSFID